MRGAHSIVVRATDGMCKIIRGLPRGEILGAHIMGEAAAEMIQCVAIAVKMKATKRDFDATVALHPSAAEELVLLKTKS